MTANRLLVPASPRFPNAVPEWDQRFMDEYSRILRLYFNQMDATNAALLGTRGGRYLDNPYGAFSRSTDFNFTAANTASLITVPTTDYASGMYYLAGDGIHVEQPGIYNLQYSVQFANTDSQSHAVWLWLKTNGVDATATASRFDVPSSHGGGDGYLIATCNFYAQLNVGDWVELWGAASQVENGITDGIYIEAYAAQTVPFPRPSIPSVVVTLSFVSVVP